MIEMGVIPIDTVPDWINNGFGNHNMVPTRKCMPLIFNTIFENGITTVNANMKGITPLTLNGDYPATMPPQGYEYAIADGRVLLRQLSMKYDPALPRYFLMPGMLYHNPNRGYREGFHDSDIKHHMNLPKSDKFTGILKELNNDPDYLEKLKRGEVGLPNPKSETDISDKIKAIQAKAKQIKDKHAYHVLPIPKGKIGFFSKIEEEFTEAKDAYIQQNPVMLLVELSDIVGAIDRFLEKNFPGVTIDHVVKQAKITKEVFNSGGRVDRDPATDPGVGDNRRN